MKMTTLLPHRWRVKREAGRHNEAIAAILDTPPIQAQRDGLVIFSMIGTAVLLPYLLSLLVLLAISLFGGAYGLEQVPYINQAIETLRGAFGLWAMR